MIEIGFQILAYASVLYLISVGLSITLGLLRFVNLAHGVFAMLGGYLAAHAISGAGLSWWLALLVVPPVVALVAALIERVLYSRLYGRGELDQVLFCIGLIFVAEAVARAVAGPLVMPVPIPPSLATTFMLAGVPLLRHKIAVIAIGVVTAAGVLAALNRTRAGAVVRAAVDNPGMAESIGLRTRAIFTTTFALGGALAALGGIAGAEVFAINPAYAIDVLIYAQLVVAVAGLGTPRGAFLSAVLVSLVQTLSAYFLPALGTTLLFTTVCIFLLWRPQGLFGSRASLT